MFKRSGPMEDNDDDAKSEQSELDEELNPEEDFRLCGKAIQEVLFDGGEVPD